MEASCITAIRSTELNGKTLRLADPVASEITLALSRKSVELTIAATCGDRSNDCGHRVGAREEIGA